MKNLRFLRYLLWPGLALATAGLVAGTVGSWTALPVALLVGGLVLILVSLVLGGYAWGKFWHSRSTQSGTNAIAATLSVLVILGLVNFLAARYDQRLDLTENQVFTLSAETETVVRNLDQPVEIVIFDNALDPTNTQLLDNYQRLGPNLTYRLVNPYEDPQTAQRFGVSGTGEVYLSAGDQTLFVQQLAQERLSERDLTNKLNQLGLEDQATVYFLQGHGEYKIDGSTAGYAQAAQALAERGFVVEALNLAEAKAIPTDAAVIVIAGLQQALFDTEQQLLATYLDGGGSLMLMVDPQVETGLDDLLGRWGVDLGDQLIVDTSGGGELVGLGPAAPLVTSYGSHPITDEFDGGRSFYPLARPVLLQERPGIEATPLLISAPQTYAEPITDAGELNVDTQQPPEGPFNIGVVLTKAASESASESAPAAPSVESSAATAPTAESTAETREANSDESEAAESPAEATAAQPTQAARLAVIGNASFATDGLFSQQLNGDVFLNTVTWLSQIDSPTLSIRPKDFTNRRIVMTVRQQIVVLVLAVLVLPVLGLIGAGAMWWRRR